LNHLGGNALPALFLRRQVQVFEFTIRELQKITKFAQLDTPSAMKYTAGTAAAQKKFSGDEWKSARRLPAQRPTLQT
jgi:hypothetical protein